MEKLMNPETLLAHLEEQHDLNDNTAINSSIRDTNQEIDKIIDDRTRGAGICCKFGWYEESERSSKYFLNLEKRNYNNKVINKLKDSKSHIVTNRNLILNEEKEFYQNLYSSKVDSNKVDPATYEQFFSTVNHKLTQEESDSIEGKISEQELLAALKSTWNGKSPGSDGFTSEFYKLFWVDIKDLLLNRINSSFETGEMFITQKHGIISLLPKKGKDLLFLKNCRPISLLNLDYKLATKYIAIRIKAHLSKLINSDQTGFIKDRYIGENINRILNIMDSVDEEDLPSVIIGIDFEKAFDSLE